MRLKEGAADFTGALKITQSCEKKNVVLENGKYPIQIGKYAKYGRNTQLNVFYLLNQNRVLETLLTPVF